MGEKIGKPASRKQKSCLIALYISTERQFQILCSFFYKDEHLVTMPPFNFSANSRQNNIINWTGLDFFSFYLEAVCLYEVVRL